MARRERLWPSRWGNKVLFTPIVKRLQTPWCEDFSVAAKGSYHKHSLHVPGLSYIQLQGTVLTVKDTAIARRYLQAFIDHRQSELQEKVEYLGEKVKVSDMLSGLDRKLAELEASEIKKVKSKSKGIS